MNKSESDQEDNDDINDNDWSYGSEKKGGTGRGGGTCCGVPRAPSLCAGGGGTGTDIALAVLGGVWHFGLSFARRSKDLSFCLQQRRGNRIR